MSRKKDCLAPGSPDCKGLSFQCPSRHRSHSPELRFKPSNKCPQAVLGTSTEPPVLSAAPPQRQDAHCPTAIEPKGSLQAPFRCLLVVLVHCPAPEQCLGMFSVAHGTMLLNLTHGPCLGVDPGAWRSSGPLVPYHCFGPILGRLWVAFRAGDGQPHA